jgi:hypothetical protein
MAMVKYACIFLVFLSTLFGYGQNKEPYHMDANFGTIEKLPVQLQKYVPAGFSAMDTVYGDLNRDSYRDLVMVLRQNDEDTITMQSTKRPLLLFTGEADGTLKFAARNDNVVYCISCGGVMGDPYQGITIKNGYFSAEHYGGSSWRWTRIITFRYSAKDNTWILHKDGGESFHAAEPEKTETKIATEKDFGRILFEKYDNEIYE